MRDLDECEAPGCDDCVMVAFNKLPEGGQMKPATEHETARYAFLTAWDKLRVGETTDSPLCPCCGRRMRLQLLCGMCRADPWPVNAGHPRVCGFNGGVFGSDNWQCASLEYIRHKMMEADKGRRGNPGSGAVCVQTDVRTSIGVWSPSVDNQSNPMWGRFLVFLWEKGGRISQAHVVDEEGDNHILTLRDAEYVLDGLVTGKKAV